jgi:DNA-binding NarL/FixJ family response regulator
VPQAAARPRVLLADDDASILKAITRLLSPACDVVGSALDSAALFEAIAHTRPDVVLLDFSLPGGIGGLELCRRVKETVPEVAVVAFTAHDDPLLERLTSEAGAAGFVWKPKAATDLLPAILAAIGRRPRAEGREPG